MSAREIGSFIGLALALVDFGMLTVVASRSEMTDQGRSVLNMARYVSLVLFPIAGWFLAPLVAGE